MVAYLCQVDVLIVLIGLQKVNNIDFFMIDRALGLGPVQQQSYYFQLIPIFLSIVGKDSELPAEGTTYRFSVSKGQQKFDQNKFPIQANFNLVDGMPFMSVATCKLNFYVPSFNRLRKQEFTLRLIQNERNKDYDVGEYSIDISQLVEAYKQEKKIRHELKTFFSEDYELDFQIYIEKTRVALEKAIKENLAERSSKSPIRAKVQPTHDDSNKPVQDNKPERDQASSEKVIDEVTQVKEEPKEKSAKNETRSPAASVKQEQTSQTQRQENIETGSVRTGKKVPLVQTKFKQLAKQDTPSQIKLKESQRLSHVEGADSTENLSTKGDTSHKQKLFMWTFLLAGAIFMYFAMHPNKRT